ncbi:uncharacterized protein BDV17DRAFT_222396 [Aspergillus undulatus]|uniref:uncharacterized protein n=1 Tax=Aspergillus undulatus TaxID=1810928 RepID=UPI003CCD5FF6
MSLDQFPAPPTSCPSPRPTSSPAPSSTPTGLHRSCLFCRARKIRCSSGPICTACQERNINCIYSPEARKGRPRGRRVNSSSSLQRQPRHAARRRDLSSSPAASRASPTNAPEPDLELFAPPSPQFQQLAGDEVRGLGMEPPGSEGQVYKGDQTLGHELEQLYDEFSIRKPGSRFNLFADSIESFHRQMQEASSEHSSASDCQPTLNYDGLLSFLAHEMVNILLMRFGHLGCERPNSASHQDLYIFSLANDRSSTMFDTPQCLQSPLAEWGKQRVCQMIDLWFFTHPLSPLVSKTLLLNAIQDETVDEALLAIILADAFQALGSSDGNNPTATATSAETPQLLAQYAASLLSQRTLSHVDAAPISTAQALILLGMRDLSRGYARRGTCYIRYTYRVITRQHRSRAGKESVEGSMKLNGMDIGLVEQELIQNIYWLCLSTTTWAFMQIDQPFSLLVPDEVPDFPSLDERTSAVLCLDRASSNISTIPSQAQARRWLWPLSHVTSTVAHIYTLYRNAPIEERKVQAAPWHTRHIHRLHHLLRSRFDPSSLSSEIREILMQAIQLVEREVTDPSCQVFLMTAYHTFIIHMLFGPERQAAPPITASTVKTLEECTAAILSIATRFPSLPTTPVPTQRSHTADTLALSLDACSRALVRIHAQGDWQQKEDGEAIPALDKLTDYAEQLHQACKSDYLGQYASFLGPVKKRLKWLQSAFRALCTPLPTRAATTPDMNSAPIPALPRGKLLFAPERGPGIPNQLPTPLEMPDPMSFTNSPVLEPLPGFPALPGSDLGAKTSTNNPHLWKGTLDRPPFGQLDGYNAVLADLLFMSPNLSTQSLDGMLLTDPFPTPITHEEHMCNAGGMLGETALAGHDSRRHV